MTTQKKIQDKIKEIQNSDKIFFTSTGARDTGQSDYKNRHTFSDLIRLAPLYDQAGYFSVEMHGGARFHQNMLSNMLHPFEEAKAWKNAMASTLTQTLVRSTNVWGYRSYPEKAIRETVKAFLPTIDVWRCFDFLNCVSNMKPLAEEVLKGGKLFEPAISFTQSDDCTNAYYLKVVDEMVALVGSPDNMLLCIKDMAGVGSPERTTSLVDSILQKYPNILLHFHRHQTDGLGLSSLLAAAKAGARILDVSDDAFVRFYGQPPVRPLLALLKENGLKTHLDEEAVDKASDVVREFIHLYKPFESEFRGPSYDVLKHRMPGGAFPSSFEQAGKGGFLHLMPFILRGMSLGNQIIRYFDVTPGSQITWTTWAAIIQRLFQEGEKKQVEDTLALVEKFIHAKQSWDSMTPAEQSVLEKLYQTASDDLKKLLLGEYGPLPFGWPEDWVYRSVFQTEYQEAVIKREKGVLPPQEICLEEEAQKLEKQLQREPTHEELILFLQHPTAAVNFLRFRKEHGDTSCLPTEAWLYGLTSENPEVRFELHGKPHTIRLISVGKENKDGTISVLFSIDNTLSEFKIETPRSKESNTSVQMANSANENEIACPMNGNLWRLGFGGKPLEVGKVYEKGDELCNIEVMKTENALKAPFKGTLKAIHVQLNDSLKEGQLMFELTPISQ